MTWDMMSILYLLVGFVVNILVNSLFVWLAGKALVGGEKAKFTDAIWIVFLGSIIGGVISAFFQGMVGSIVGSIISFIIWLGLIKHFFDCGWIKAFIIAVLAVIIQIVVSFIIELILGVAIFALGI